MPSSSLNVPHFQQELEYSCVAACARMVLAHYGDTHTETDLRLVLFLKTGSLESWSMDIFHATVVIGLDAMTVTLDDPYFATAPQLSSLPSFEKAWAETGQFAAFIRPRRMP